MVIIGGWMHVAVCSTAWMVEGWPAMTAATLLDTEVTMDASAPSARDVSMPTDVLICTVTCDWKSESEAALLPTDTDTEAASDCSTPPARVASFNTRRTAEALTALAWEISVNRRLEAKEEVVDREETARLDCMVASEAVTAMA